MYVDIKLPQTEGCALAAADPIMCDVTKITKFTRGKHALVQSAKSARI